MIIKLFEFYNHAYKTVLSTLGNFSMLVQLIYKLNVNIIINTLVISVILWLLMLSWSCQTFQWNPYKFKRVSV